MGLENEDFSDEGQCQCMYIFFGIRKTSTQKISTNQTPPWKIPTWNIPTHVFKYSRPSFLKKFFIPVL